MALFISLIFLIGSDGTSNVARQCLSRLSRILHTFKSSYYLGKCYQSAQNDQFVTFHNTLFCH